MEDLVSNSRNQDPLSAHRPLGKKLLFRNFGHGIVEVHAERSEVELAHVTGVAAPLNRQETLVDLVVYGKSGGHEDIDAAWTAELNKGRQGGRFQDKGIVARWQYPALPVYFLR